MARPRRRISTSVTCAARCTTRSRTTVHADGSGRDAEKSVVRVNAVAADEGLAPLDGLPAELADSVDGQGGPSSGSSSSRVRPPSGRGAHVFAAPGEADAAALVELVVQRGLGEVGSQQRARRARRAARPGPWRAVRRRPGAAARGRSVASTPPAPAGRRRCRRRGRRGRARCCAGAAGGLDRGEQAVQRALGLGDLVGRRPSGRGRGCDRPAPVLAQPAQGLADGVAADAVLARPGPSRRGTRRRTRRRAGGGDVGVDLGPQRERAVAVDAVAAGVRAAQLLLLGAAPGRSDGPLRCCARRLSVQLKCTYIRTLWQGEPRRDMLQVEVLETSELGDRSYVAHDGTVAMVVDPQRDIDRVEAVLAERGLTLRGGPGDPHAQRLRHRRPRARPARRGRLRRQRRRPGRASTATRSRDGDQLHVRADAA